MHYAELTCKTNFSFLTGASYPHEVMERAAELGLSAVAITDDNGVYGIPKAYHAAKACSTTKLITGCELHLTQGGRLWLLAKNRQGYAHLCKLITEVQRPPLDQPRRLTHQQLIQHLSSPHQLIALSDPHPRTPWAQLKALFAGELYVTMMRFLDGHDQRRTQQTEQVQRRFGLQAVAVNDVHYHLRARANLQDVMTAIRHRTSLSQAGFKLFSNHERHLKSPQQMHRLFQDQPHALANSLCIADRCCFSPGELRYTYPSEWIPAGHSAQSYLQQLVWQGAQRKYPSHLPDGVKRQIEHELKLVAELNFADYFLTIYEIVDFARKQQILCQGRGSAANSIICYCLDITAIDPIRMNLLFERFISAERGEPPDIDVDFEHERREEVIQHIYQKYGRHRAGMVAAVITYRRRSALREVCKAFQLPIGTLSARKIERDFDKLTQSDGVQQQRILSMAEQLEGFPRHLSIHSGGFTLSAGSLVDIVPIQPARMQDRTIIQWDKYDLDYLGLLKIDVLGLGMLTALHKSLNSVGMKLDDIPAEDPETYAMIQRADTVGTFQIESRAQMSMLGRLQPKNFYDLVIEVAIVRPGPIVGKMVHPYLRRRRGEEQVEYFDGRVEKILKKTLGVPLFQEQVMKLAIELADFSPGEADQLRRAIAAWRSTGSVTRMGKRLMQGLCRCGLPSSFAEQIFEQIQGFAKYGFPESHAASFALIAYATCYMKCHHPADFLAALINSQPLGFYANHTLIDDAKRHGVQVKPVDLNHSPWDCVPRGKQVRLGLRVVRGMSKQEGERIMAERESRPFRDIFDFLRRSKLRRHILCRLAMGDAFKTFDLDQRHALWDILEYERLYQSDSTQQLGLFADTEHHASTIQLQRLGLLEQVHEDYQAFNLSLNGHPMQALRQLEPKIPQQTIAQIREAATRSRICFSGMSIIKQKPSTAGGMLFCTFEDESGFLDSAIPPKLAEKYRPIILHHCFFVAQGILQRDGHSLSVLIQKLAPVFAEPEQDPFEITPSKFFR